MTHLHTAPWAGRSPPGWPPLPGSSAPAPQLGRQPDPIHPLSLENAYADPALLRDLGARGAQFARDLGVDVVVGAETAGVPLAAAVSLAAGCRSPSSASRATAATRSTNRRSEARTWRAGACCWSTTRSPAAPVQRFTAALAGAGAEVAGVFVLVDMRDVADTVSPVAAALPTESVSTYLQVLDLATADGLLDPAVHDLTVDASSTTGPRTTRAGTSCPSPHDDAHSPDTHQGNDHEHHAAGHHHRPAGAVADAVAMRFEVTTLPVADVDRAKAFYQRLGWRLDIDFKPSPDTRGVQFTPPGSQASIQFGQGTRR